MKKEEWINKCIPELKFSSSRAGGSGGQHVNKVETKVTLKWHIEGSNLLDKKQKERLLLRLKNKINQEGELVLQQQSERSQIRNKEKIILKWKTLVLSNLQIRKKRKATKPSKESVRKIKKKKQERSKVKRMRRKPNLED